MDETEYTYMLKLGDMIVAKNPDQPKYNYPYTKNNQGNLHITAHNHYKDLFSPSYMTKLTGDTEKAKKLMHGALDQIWLRMSNSGAVGPAEWVYKQVTKGEKK